MSCSRRPSGGGSDGTSPTTPTVRAPRPPRAQPTTRASALPPTSPEPLIGFGAGEVAALATTFPHTMRLADGSLRPILALGEVATHPDYRGRRHGVAAVEVS